MRVPLPLKAHVHGVLHAGRFDRSPALARKAALAGLKANDHYATTEVSRDLRAEALDGIPGTVLAHVEGPGGRDECAMLLKRWKWRSVRWEIVALNPGALDVTPTSGWHRIYALVVTATHFRTRQVHRWVLVHMPAHVQAGRRFRPGPDLVVWQRCIRTLARLATEYLAEVDHLTILGDFNVDAKEPWVRDYLAAVMPPALQLAWRSPWPRGGTHTDRIIDLWLTTLEVEETSLEPDDGSSDHRPARFRGRMPRRPSRVLSRLRALAKRRRA